jgi:hypothetical protein
MTTSQEFYQKVRAYMEKPLHKFLLLSLISIGIVGLQWLLCRLLPMPIGLISWIPTIIILEALESTGLPTLKGSPDGVPVPTEFGLVISALIWWLVWLLLVYLRLRVPILSSSVRPTR